MSTDQATGEVRLRPATDADVDAIAEVMLAARDGAVAAGTMPPAVHPASDMPRHVREDVLPHREVWVADEGVTEDGGAEEGGEVEPGVLGVLVLDAAWLDDLYVVPHSAGRGIGSALLQLAQARRPGGFDLWVFEVNVTARQFYQRHGLVEVERTDGAGNEERAPDIRLRWSGTRHAGE